jgi:hypothetical protein
MSRLMIFAMIAAILIGAESPAHAASGVPTLTGESFSSFGPSPMVTLQTTQCAMDGSGTISFTATGPATGPIPGTFTESGTIQLGPPLGAVRRTLAFSATFHIDSAFAQVDGTKFVTGQPFSESVCGGFPGNTVVLINLVVRYEATIRPAAGGAFSDEGTSLVNASAPAGIGCCTTLSPATFLEAFVSDLTEAVPLLPTTKDACRDGGWQLFGVFKNQGDCVSFLATGGKNRPAMSLP